MRWDGNSGKMNMPEGLGGTQVLVAEREDDHAVGADFWGVLSMLRRCLTVSPFVFATLLLCVPVHALAECPKIPDLMS
jgi:hypothetical protein